MMLVDFTLVRDGLVQTIPEITLNEEAYYTVRQALLNKDGFLRVSNKSGTEYTFLVKDIFFIEAVEDTR